MIRILVELEASQEQTSNPFEGVLALGSAEALSPAGKEAGPWLSEWVRLTFAGQDVSVHHVNTESEPPSAALERRGEWIVSGGVRIRISTVPDADIGSLDETFTPHSIRELTRLTEPQLSLVSDGHELRYSLAREGEAFVVGRDCEEVDLVLNDQHVSGRHARFVRHEGAVFIEDLESRHGTLVNGGLISEATRLVHGDTIMIGNTRIEFTDVSSLLGEILRRTRPDEGSESDSRLEDERFDLSAGLQSSSGTSAQVSRSDSGAVAHAISSGQGGATGIGDSFLRILSGKAAFFFVGAVVLLMVGLAAAIFLL